MDASLDGSTTNITHAAAPVEGPMTTQPVFLRALCTAVFASAFALAGCGGGGSTPVSISVPIEEGAPAGGGSGHVPPSVRDAITAVQAKPAFASATWGFHVIDLASGEVLLNQAGGTSLVPASTMKVFSVATALERYGANYRFHTPVYRVGEVSNGMLAGDLVLVASGDFSFGLREQADGTLAFNNLPEVDHNSTYTGFPGGAFVKNSNPLAALDALAAQVKAAGIGAITGDVLIDDRLFETYRNFPSGTIAPIWVNENVIDITVTPGGAGEKPAIDWRPKSAAITVENDVTTVAGPAGPLTVTTPSPGVVRVSGSIAADSAPVLTMSQIADPSAFARTAFIEALARAGVTVAAQPLAAAGALPDASAYLDAARVAERVSPPLSEYVRVILKVSYNRGADLMLCLAAVKAGSRDCSDGLAEELKVLGSHGIASTYPFDGAGSNGNNRTTASDIAGFLGAIAQTPTGIAIRNGMAVLGVDGSQAQNGLGTPAAGHVRIKDGDLIAGTAAGQLIAIAMTQAGFIDARSGRRLVYSVFVNNAAFWSFEDYAAARAELASIVVAFQQSY